jgi:hypothetical protein
MHRRTALAAATLPALFGCATNKPTVVFSEIDLNTYAGIVNLPPLNSSMTVNIGDRMIATRRVAVLPYISLEKPAVIDAKYSDKWRLLTDMRAGVYNLVATDRAGGNYFRQAQSLSSTYKSTDPGTKDTPGPDHKGGIFVSPNGQAFTYVMWEGYKEPSLLVAASELQISRGIVEVDLPGENLQKELLYLGLSQSTITLRYREYWRGVSRPDFSLEVRYDLAQSRSIGYKDSRFEVLDANNTSITYKTSAHLK